MWILEAILEISRSDNKTMKAIIFFVTIAALASFVLWTTVLKMIGFWGLSVVVVSMFCLIFFFLLFSFQFSSASSRKAKVEDLADALVVSICATFFPILYPIIIILVIRFVF